MFDREKILQKIQKCLSLSSSSNEHEAAIALRQAQKLMDEYGISNNEVLAAEASEQSTAAGAAIKPAYWESLLARTVANAFGCRLLFVGTYLYRCSGTWNFIGTGVNPEIAAYAYQVLFRQAKRARSDYIKTALKRCKVATKTRRADIFSNAWINAVSSNVQKFAGSEQTAVVIDAYMQLHHPKTEKLTSNDRNSGRTLKEHEWNDYKNGAVSGKEAKLQHGVKGSEHLSIGSAS